MLKIRLQRVGRKHDPKFRVVVTQSHKGPKAGKHVEIVGFYDAKTGERKIDGERAKYWISKGAQTSGVVHNFLIDDKVLTGKKINVLPKIKVKEVEEAEEKEKIETSAPTEADTSSTEEPKVEADAIIEETKEEKTAEAKKEAPVEEKTEEPKVEKEEETKEEKKEKE